MSRGYENQYHQIPRTSQGYQNSRQNPVQSRSNNVIDREIPNRSKSSKDKGVLRFVLGLAFGFILLIVISDWINQINSAKAQIKQLKEQLQDSHSQLIKRITKIEQYVFPGKRQSNHIDPNPVPEPRVIIQKVPLLKNSFLLESQRQNLESLLKDFDINQNYKIVFDHQKPHEHKLELNRAISNNNQFILISLTKSDKRHVFGVYANQNQDEQKLSFIFNLNTQTISKIQKPHLLLQLDHSGKSGPKFGKSDIIFFNQINNKSTSHFCGSFKCPSQIQFGTPQSRTYLAGVSQFIVENMIVIAKK